MQQCVAAILVREEKVKDMPVVPAAGENGRKSEQTLLLQGEQLVLVAVPHAQALLLNFLSPVQLAAEVGCVEVGSGKAASRRNPGVAVGLAPGKCGAIGPVFPDLLGTLNEVTLVQHQQSALSAGDVFGFMERQCSHITKSPQLFFPENRLQWHAQHLR